MDIFAIMLTFFSLQLRKREIVVVLLHSPGNRLADSLPEDADEGIAS